MARPSLESISRRYGQNATFGHKDYEAAKRAGYSTSEIKSWLDQDLNRLHPDNRPGGISGLYDEISSGYVDPTKAVNIDRGASYVPTESSWDAPFEPEGMTPFEYDYQKTLDLANIDKQIKKRQIASAENIQRLQNVNRLAIADIDKQIKEMQLESAENIQKLSNMNKLSVANTAVNQSVLGGLVNAFNF